MNNRKTTISGIGVILGGLATAAAEYASSGQVNVGVLISALFTGIGLVMAKDAGNKPVQ